MVPSGITTVIEQIVKLAVGLYCAVKFMPDVHKAVMGAVVRYNRFRIRLHGHNVDSVSGTRP